MKALYRKYRPKTLDEVIGQEKVTDVLKNSLKSGKISHAYLFTGPRGTGKTSVARIFAHEINHFDYELEDSYVDIIEIDAASNTGVDNIRELREKAAIAPTKGEYKIYIIDEVHMLSKSAFNALLKTLEEPPKHVVFILATTDIEKVPITITSRVQKYTFGLASTETMVSHLKTICEKEKIKIDDGALKIIAKRGGGSFRDTLSLLDQISTLTDKKITKDLVEQSLGLPKDELIAALLNSYETADLSEISKNLKEILNSGTKPEILAEDIINRILETPKPELLPLLSKLTDVKAPFPEAKLLLAFTNFVQPVIKVQQTVQTITKQPQQKPTSAADEIRTKLVAKKAESKKTKEQTTEDSEPKPAEMPAEIEVKTEETTVEIQPNSGNFSWENYLTTIKSASIAVYLQLKKCDFSLENGILHIIPDKSITKNILDKENNRNILKKSVENYAILIHEPLENSPNSTKNNPKFSAINDIMGETQEVKSGGEIPF